MDGEDSLASGGRKDHSMSKGGTERVSVVLKESRTHFPLDSFPEFVLPFVQLEDACISPILQCA